MPHFGLMNTNDSFQSPEGALLRARLHIRGGRRRLRQGKISAGILTLYDAMLFALRWYAAGPGKGKAPGLQGIDLSDDRALYRALVGSGVLDGSFDYAGFDGLVERASKEDLSGYDYSAILHGIEGVMTGLGVIPFDEEALSPEDPSTF